MPSPELTSAKQLLETYHKEPKLQGLIESFFAFDPDHTKNAEMELHDELEWAVWNIRSMYATIAAYSVLASPDLKKRTELLAKELKEVCPMMAPVDLNKKEDNHKFDGLKLILGGKE